MSDTKNIDEILGATTDSADTAEVTGTVETTTSKSTDKKTEDKKVDAKNSTEKKVDEKKSQDKKKVEKKLTETTKSTEDANSKNAATASKTEEEAAEATIDATSENTTTVSEKVKSVNRAVKLSKGANMYKTPSVHKPLARVSGTVLVTGESVNGFVPVKIKSNGIEISGFIVAGAIGQVM